MTPENTHNAQSRREFLQGTAWMGLAAMAAGCMGRGMKVTSGCGAPMQGYADKPMDEVRVGVVGLGTRGPMSARRLAIIPGIRIVALCDVLPERVAAANEWRVNHGMPKAREYTGPEGYKAMCASDDIDAIYSVTSWEAHHAINMCAMRNGKHIFTEMPGALTVDDLWEEVEASEKYHRHCMLLENCCYGDYEMLGLNMVRQGLFGELYHGEAAYIHDQRSLYILPEDKPNEKTVFAGKVRPAVGPSWKDLYFEGVRHGNWYPTHGLGPVARAMNINRGDRFDYIVSLESGQKCVSAYAKERFPEGSWQRKMNFVRGDMSQTLIRTAMGRSILLQHDVQSPSPYTRMYKLAGTKGVFRKYPDLRFCWEEKIGDGGAEEFFSPEKTEELKNKYRHPLWKMAGDLALKIGGHGGMDVIMDLRWSYCLRNGLPLDTDVYDMASWSSMVELTERSVNNHSAVVDVPDFTRGGWKYAPAFAPEEFDPAKITLPSVSDAGEQQTV